MKVVLKFNLKSNLSTAVLHVYIYLYGKKTNLVNIFKTYLFMYFCIFFFKKETILALNSHYQATGEGPFQQVLKILSFSSKYFI